jgi:hypothetical protein
MPPKLEEGVPTERLNMMVPRTLLVRVNEWRRNQPHIPAKSEAVRFLIEYALHELEKKKGEG